MSYTCTSKSMMCGKLIRYLFCKFADAIKHLFQFH